MTEHAVFRVADREPAKPGEPLGDYDQFADPIGLNSAATLANAGWAAAVPRNVTLTSGLARWPCR